MFIQGEKGEKFVRTDRELSRGLIVSRWHRREPAGDDYDHVSVIGLTQAFESMELVYQPVNFGEAFQADARSFAEVYTRDDEVTEKAHDSLRTLREKIAELENQEWVSDAS